MPAWVVEPATTGGGRLASAPPDASRIHELRRASLGGCATGGAAITEGYALPARYVIHAVGPVWRGGGRGEAALLASCYRRAIELAAERELASIAFPAISCGAYRYPLDQAAAIAVREVRAKLPAAPAIDRVVFACFDARALAVYRAALGAPPD